MNHRLQRFMVAVSGALLLLASQAVRAIETVTVIEDYNQSLDAYFISARPTEQTLLDHALGFSRTGTRFVANAAASFYASSSTPA